MSYPSCKLITEIEQCRELAENLILSLTPDAAWISFGLHANGPKS